MHNATYSAKVFLFRSLAILEKNGQRHQEALHKWSSLETKVAKWRATARMVWRQECLKVANTTITFAEAISSNHQLSSKVGNVLAKLLSTWLDSDELFARCKGLQEEKKGLAG